MIGFYLFMFVMTLSIPAGMVGIGSHWRKDPPKRINEIYGYRTKRSMSSQEAWEFAHRYFGRLWVALGWTVLAVTIVVMAALPLFTLEVGKVGAVGGVVVLLQFPFMLAPLFLTERTLKQKFDF